MFFRPIDVRMNQVTAGLLDDGETLIHSLRADCDWVAGVSPGGAGAAGAGVTSGSSAGSGGPHVRFAGALKLPPRLALSLTQRRLILWKRHTLFFQLTTLIGSIPLSDVRRMFARKASNHVGLTIVFQQGPDVRLHTPKKDRAKEFVQEWKKLQTVG